jgi:hypothetical protein
MGLAKNDELIQALAADRPDQPFGKARWLFSPMLSQTFRRRLYSFSHKAYQLRQDVFCVRMQVRGFAFRPAHLGFGGIIAPARFCRSARNDIE